MMSHSQLLPGLHKPKVAVPQLFFLLIVWKIKKDPAQIGDRFGRHGFVFYMCVKCIVSLAVVSSLCLSINAAISSCLGDF